MTFAQIKISVHCEEQGRIQVRGIAYPVATYTVVGQRADLAAHAAAVHAELPHMRLDADPQLMSLGEREEATQILRRLLNQLP
jgi:adenylate cyclase